MEGSGESGFAGGGVIGNFGVSNADYTYSASGVYVGALDDLQNVAEPEQNLGDTQYGYAAGFVRGRIGDEQLSAVSVLGNPNDDAGVALEFYPGEGGPGDLEGRILVEGGGHSYSYDLGDYDSLYLNDNVFAAWGLGTSVDDTPVTLANGGSVPTTYIFSHDAINSGASPELLANCSDCDFAQWGWWTVDAQGHADFGEGDEPVHTIVKRGTWVAGDIVEELDYIDVEITTIGLAHYSGYAVGTVVNSIGPTTIQYGAGGRLDLTWDFSNTTGTIAISNFDGHDFGGVLYATDNGEVTTGFQGNVYGMGLSGTAEGSFVYADVGENTHVAGGGVIGDFAVAGENYAANGIFVGKYDEPTVGDQTLTELSGFAPA